MKFLFLGFLLMQLSAVVTAESVYKWIDEDGHVHYDSRADNKDAEEIKIKKVYINKKTKSEPEAESKKPLNAEERAKKLKRFVSSIDKEKKAKEDEEIAKKKAEETQKIRCDASRDQLKRAKDSGALYDVDKKGKRVLLNKKLYEQALKQAKARVEKWCN